MSDLHINITSGVAGGGLRGCFASLAQAFSALGAKVDVFSSLGEQYPGLRSRLEQDGIKVVQDEAFEVDSVRKRKHASQIIAENIAGKGYECESILLGGALRDALAFRRVRRILDGWGLGVFVAIQLYSLRHRSKFWSLFYHLGSAVYRHTTDHIFVPCNREYSRLTSRGFPPARCSVAHLPISTTFSALDVSPSESLIRVLDRAGEGPILTFLGNFHPSKGQMDLVEMMPYLRAEFPQSTLVLAGSGSNLESCHQRAKDLGLADSIIFPGRLPQSDVPLLLKSSAVAVIASRAETFGYCIVEPLLFGVPVVSTEVGIASELKSLRAIQVFEKGRSSDAADKVSMYLRNPALASREAAVGQMYVKQNCLGSGVANMMLDTFEARGLTL